MDWNGGIEMVDPKKKKENTEKWGIWRRFEEENQMKENAKKKK